MIIEMATIHAGMCTRFRVITKTWIHQLSMQQCERIEYHGDYRDYYTCGGTCTRCGVITYKLDSSSRSHRTMSTHVEERVEYNSDHRDGYNPCRHVH